MVQHDALTDRFEDMPIKAFKHLRTVENIADALSRMVGGGVWIQPMYHVSDLGNWENGWTVIADVAATDNHPAQHIAFRVHSKKLTESGNRIESMSPGKVMDMLDRAVFSERFYGTDLTGLAMTLAQTVAQDDFHNLDDDWKWNRAGTMNRFHAAWMLHHAISLLGTETREATQFLIALALSTDQAEKVHQVLTAVQSVTENWQHTDEAETVVRETVHRFNGTTLSGGGIEKTALVGMLMQRPASSWTHETELLVAHLHATDPSLLSAEDAKKQRRSTYGPARAGFPLAG